ncbi:type II toxin-antitoxin system HicB family antitoxin [Pleomorphomonas carboxyditropha]|uniref:HicB family protein n=1 Tax=Pleomorphomonas carboxyditropha TaxID=2023338 RepID=A0A2G9WP07_9HYPH|nr:HicB family protein [Pleomorphomonas carboxyditropha]PIO96436.1 HicB family protein [Pleomorphomonas carboxyditropha]
MKTYGYAAQFEPGDDPGIIVVTFPDVPEAITEGEGMSDARLQAADALGTALLAYIRMGRALPEPKATGETISPPSDITAKLAVLEAFAEAGISRSELARRIGKDEKEARRILDPMHPTKLAMLEQALAALGRRLVIGVEKAA